MDRDAPVDERFADGRVFLTGLFEPVEDERDDADLEVEGEIPPQLDGLFVRNGPNPRFEPIDGYHPFDGDGMLHGVYLQDGRARYRNRWVRSKGLQAEMARGRALFGGFGGWVPPDPEVVAEVGPMKNTANTNVVRHSGRIFALMEAAPPTEIDWELETIGECDFGGRLEGPMTAHPRIDPVDGEMHFFGYWPMPPYLRYHVVDPAGELVHSTVIDIPAPVMIHDFVLTEDYAVFLDAPAVFDLHGLLAGGKPLRWEPDRGTRIGVLPRGAEGSQIRWFEVENGYVVHFFNAFSEGGVVEVHGPRFEEMPTGFELGPRPEDPVPLPWKWTIDLDSGKVVEEQTDETPGEFPRINEALMCRRHRYGYMCIARDWGFDLDFCGVAKSDIRTGTTVRHLYEEHEVCGEHVFVPDPEGSAEDDGWLMSFVVDRRDRSTDLVILDARDLGADPVARVHIPRRVPIGFHAAWIPRA
ncbi:MAG: carotenoid cleavage dioxygenase [Acidimicrobiales bacterium]|nr:MAG: carotenoid cleavage dioxygenase [Acidimicrobiales bacterium]